MFNMNKIDKELTEVKEQFESTMDRVEATKVLLLMEKAENGFEGTLEEYMIERANADNIEDGPFMEMAAVHGGFMEIKLCVWGREGPTPHFHFYKGVSPNQGIPNDGYGGGCMCIMQPNYFRHASHKDKMKPKEIKGLIKFLNSSMPGGKLTVWDYIIMTWNGANPEQTQVPINTPIPEYTNNMTSVIQKNNKFRFNYSNKEDDYMGD